METEPKVVIRKAIEMPANIDKEDYDFWKLQFKLKWELEINHDKKMEPIKMALANAFTKLNYENPEQEAQLILLYSDGIASSMLKGSGLDVAGMIQFLLTKYEL